MKAFSLSTTPQLHFGMGSVALLSSLLSPFGSKILLVTGSKSFMTTEHGKRLLNQLQEGKGHVHHIKITREPTPEDIDRVIQTADRPDVVIGIGGGSVLDAGKAISAMLPLRESVKNYLEGVGTKVHPGTKVPFLAVPTTAGTGSEATKNAVLSEVGEQGYKKSLRHNHFVPDVAIVDPALTFSCPPGTTAASGMDAFTQLVESYLSPAASPITDTLSYEGLRRISTSLSRAYHDGENAEARSNMAFAAYLSGITLANAGLGLVHGFASAIGGYYDIPHGVICSALMAAANRQTVRKLRDSTQSEIALKKYSELGKLFCVTGSKSGDYAIDAFLSFIEERTVAFGIPRISSYGITSDDFSKIVGVAENKNNPIALSPDEMMDVLSSAG